MYHDFCFRLSINAPSCIDLRKMWNSSTDPKCRAVTNCNAFENKLASNLINFSKTDNIEKIFTKELNSE